MAAISPGDPRDAELLLGPRSNGSDAHGTASFRFRPVNCATDRQHMSDSLISSARPTRGRASSSPARGRAGEAGEQGGPRGPHSLHYACLEEQLEVTELLLQAGADPSAGDSDGTTCLHIAATLERAARAAAPRHRAAARDRPAGLRRRLDGAAHGGDARRPEQGGGGGALRRAPPRARRDATVRDKAGKVASDYAELARPRRPLRHQLSLVGGRRRRIATPTTDEPAAGGPRQGTPADTFDGSAPPTEDLEASVGRRRRRRQGGVQVAEPAADEAPFNPAFERAEGAAAAAAARRARGVHRLRRQRRPRQRRPRRRRQRFHVRRRRSFVRAAARTA